MKKPKKQPMSQGDRKMKEYHKKGNNSLSLGESMKKAAKSVQAFCVAVNGWKR